MLPNILQISIFWLVQTSALLVFSVPFRWAYVGLWAASHFLRASPARGIVVFATAPRAFFSIGAFCSENRRPRRRRRLARPLL